MENPMIERRKQPPTEIWENVQVNRRGLLADRPRKNDVQGHQGAEQSATGARDQSGWLTGRLLKAAAAAPEVAPETSGARTATTVDARLRVGILVTSLAAVVMSTNALGILVDAVGSIPSRLRTSAVIASQNLNVETLVSLSTPNKIEWSRSQGEKIASPGNRVASLDRPCVRPEVHRAASDRRRFFWLLRDKHDRIVEESPITYVSDTEARSAADGAATGHACNTRVTATRGRENL